jgi:hypothetical protein
MFLMTIEMYKLWHKRTTSVISIQDNERARTDVVNYLFSAFEVYSDRIWNVGRSYSVLPVHQVRTVG